MKFIFLDIDGVLNSRFYDRHRDWSVQSDIDESRLRLLKRLVDETGAKLVLSSTWREHWERAADACDEDGRYINETLGKYGLSIFDKTPVLGLGKSRADEVRQWLKDTAATVESFVIIDDYRYDWGEMADKFVKTDPNFRLGLEEEHVKRAIEILGKN